MVKGVNLIPADVRRSWLYARVRKGVYAAFVVYVGILTILFFNQRVVLAEKRAEVKEMERALSEAIAGSTEYAALKEKEAAVTAAEGELRRRLASAAGLAGAGIPWSGLLKRLSHDIPGRVWLRSLSTSDLGDGAAKRVRFLGSALSNRAVADFIFTLENSGDFRDVRLAYTQKRDFDEKTVYDFEISGEFVVKREAGDGR